jgi:hypothetical protein
VSQLRKQKEHCWWHISQRLLTCCLILLHFFYSSFPLDTIFPHTWLLDMMGTCETRSVIMIERTQTRCPQRLIILQVSLDCVLLLHNWLGSASSINYPHQSSRTRWHVGSHARSSTSKIMKQKKKNLSRRSRCNWIIKFSEIVAAPGKRNSPILSTILWPQLPHLQAIKQTLPCSDWTRKRKPIHSFF